MEETSLRRFIDIYRQTFGENISEEEALRKARSVVDLYAIVYKHVNKNDHAK